MRQLSRLRLIYRVGDIQLRQMRFLIADPAVDMRSGRHDCIVPKGFRFGFGLMLKYNYTTLVTYICAIYVSPLLIAVIYSSARHGCVTQNGFALSF